MKKKIEEFITDHRKELDAEQPPTLTWDKMQLSLQGQRNKKKAVPMQYWLAVACVVVLILASVLLWPDKQTDSATPAAAVKTGDVLPPDLKNEIDPAFTRQLYEVATIIETKQTELKQVGKQYPQLVNRFEKEINQLDSTYAGLKGVLAQYPGQEEVLSSMIQTLQLQLDLLNKQLQIIKQLKNTNNDNQTL
jgi:hypothetical protein